VVSRSVWRGGLAWVAVGLLAVLAGCSGTVTTTPEATPTPGAQFLMPTPMAPVTDAPYTATPEMLKYVVQEGDTLYDIALRYEVDMDELIRINKLTDPNNLTLGQELWIPIPPRETVTPSP
jgi:nucleoid-associated protein YgaU